MLSAGRAVHSSSVNPRLVILALTMGAFAIGSTAFSAMSLITFFTSDLGIDQPTGGHAISAYALGVAFGAPSIAVMAAGAARRTLLISLMGLCALGNALSAMAPTYEALLVFRFLAGLPHGAYFGVAALVAASLVPVNKRALSVAQVMTGLTVSTIIGVPVVNWLGQSWGWRSGFAIVAVPALVTIALLVLFAPKTHTNSQTNPIRELAALKRPQVLLTLLTGAIGFGGLFAVYTYVVSTMTTVTQIEQRWVPLVLSLFGVGMTLGNLVAGWAADRHLNRTAIILMTWTAIALALFPFAAENAWTLALDIFLIGCGGGLGTVLQTRLMDVAGDSQTLAAAAHHSAFNFANALGPWLGGLAIAAGYGLTSTGWIGAALSLGGLAIFVTAITMSGRPIARTAIA